jgi:deazaflavin-dependent oxidoreductase (nitroreductase family)
MARAVRVDRLTRVLWRAHRRIYGRFGGRLGTFIGSFPVLMLTTTGRHSGEARRVALFFVDLDDGVGVIGSFAGESRDPAWVLNLRAHPRASVQIGRDVFPVEAREVWGTDRDRIAAMFEERDRAYTTYRERTSRTLPVFVLEASG